MATKFPSYSNSSNTSLGEIWSHNMLIAEKCATAKRDIDQFLGTAYVARDLISVVDALGEDGMLRYWNKSFKLQMSSSAD